MVAANHGASVPDIVAIGPDRENITEWQTRCGINRNEQIRLVKLSHMRYQHPDLEQITIFLEGILQFLPIYQISCSHLRLWHDRGQANRKRNLVSWLR